VSLAIVPSPTREEPAAGRFPADRVDVRCRPIRLACDPVLHDSRVEVQQQRRRAVARGRHESAGALGAARGWERGRSQVTRGLWCRLRSPPLPPAKNRPQAGSRRTGRRLRRRPIRPRVGQFHRSAPRFAL